jgi:hypothetical protein
VKADGGFCVPARGSGIGRTLLDAIAGIGDCAQAGENKPTVIGKLIEAWRVFTISQDIGDILSYSRLMALMWPEVIATVVNMLGALPGSIVF